MARALFVSCIRTARPDRAGCCLEQGRRRLLHKRNLRRHDLPSPPRPFSPEVHLAPGQLLSHIRDAAPAAHSELAEHADVVYDGWGTPVLHPGQAHSRKKKKNKTVEFFSPTRRGPAAEVRAVARE